MPAAKPGRIRSRSRLESITRTNEEAQQRAGLLEFVVALAVISALTIIIMFTQQKYLQVGKNEALRIEYRTIITATQAYFRDYRQYPDNADELAVAGYIDSVPTLATYNIDRSTGKIIQIPR